METKNKPKPMPCKNCGEPAGRYCLGEVKKEKKFYWGHFCLECEPHPNDIIGTTRRSR